MKSCKVYQSLSPDGVGITNIPGNYYWTWQAAKDAGDGYDGPMDPLVHDAVVLDDGRVFLVKEVIKVYEDREELIKERAIGKLSPVERAVLGLK